MLKRTQSIPRPRQPRAASHQEGVVLLEALVAILIFSFGILGLIGLQASATKTASQAKFRVDAGRVASEQIATLWLDRANLALYNGTRDVSAVLPEGVCTTAIVGTEATVTVSWRAPGDAAPNSLQAYTFVTTN